MKKRTAFCLLALINLIGAWQWHIEDLGIGASIVSCAIALVFLYGAFRRRRLRPPGANATPEEKAQYNLLRVAHLTGAEEITGGWSLRSGNQTFLVYHSYIVCSGRGSTCYQSISRMPPAEKLATALLFLHSYPQAWTFWAKNHGLIWQPPQEEASQ